MSAVSLTVEPRRRHGRRLVVGALCAVCAAALAMPAASDARSTLTLLPSAIEVRSSFTSDGKLEFLVPRDLSDDGVIVGVATDLHRDYAYEVGWYWSRATGLRAVDPSNGKKPWVADPGGDKLLRSVCQRVVGATAYCTDDIGDVLYSYSARQGLRRLDRGDPEALDAISRALSDVPARDAATEPIPVVWKAANERGNAGLLASVRLGPDSHHPFGLVHSPERGWRLMSSLDPRLDIGEEGINDPQYFNRRGDSIFNQGIVGGRQEVYLLNGATHEVTVLGLGSEYTSGLCRHLTEDRKTCGTAFAGSYSTPGPRSYVSWVYDPAHGVRRITLPPRLVPYTRLPNGDLLVSGEFGSSRLVWSRYIPESRRLMPLVTKREYKRFFPRGTRKIERADYRITPVGDLLLSVTGTFRGREITRNLYYFAESDQLADIWDLIREADLVDLDGPRAPVFTAERTVELVLDAAVNSHGESVWLAFVDGRPRVVLFTP